MNKTILIGLVLTGIVLPILATPAARFSFRETDRANNALLQEFQKKDMKLYRFVPDSGNAPITFTNTGASIPAGWHGSYRTGDRKLFAGDQLELTFSGREKTGKFLLELSRGQPFCWEKTEVHSFEGSIENRGATKVLRMTIPEEWNGFWLRKFLIRTTSPLTLYQLEIFRAPRNTRLDADRILAIPPRHEAKVKSFHGTPQLYVDGAPFNGLGFGSFIYQQYGNYNDMLGKTGFRLASFVVNLGEDILTRWNPPSWLGPDHFDFSAIDRQAKKLLDIAPDVKIILQIQLDGAEWWTLAHPENGGIHGREGVPDYQSEAWKRDCRDAVRQLVAHVQSASYGPNVIGYELFNGVSLDCNFEVNDETPAALARFRAFLRERYGSEAALQKAWGNLEVTFDNAIPENLPEYAANHPDWKARLLVDDPAKMARYFDSKRFRELAFQQTILDFVSWIKEATHGRALAGARTGDFMANQWDLPKAGIAENDCNPIDLLLTSPDFDFFDIQPPYLGRHRLGTQGGGIPHLPTHSLALHNKLLLFQDDVPHLVKPMPDRRTLLEMKRLVNCYALFHGAICYQWEMSHYHLNTPWLLEEFRRSREIAERAIRLDRSSVAEAAIVFDLDYQRYLGLDEKMHSPSRTAVLLDHLKWTWNRAGIPVDLVSLQDLPQLRDYKLYIFANTFDGSPQKQRIIADAVRNSGKVSIFMWADGYFDKTARSCDSMKALCGIDVKDSMQERTWNILKAPALKEVVSKLFPLGHLTDTMPGEPGAAQWTYAPSFTVTDPDALALGFYAEGGETAIAIKKFPDWYSVYSASVVISPALLRYAANIAGIFRYVDTEDLFYANSSFLALHGAADSIVKLRLPTATPLYEVFTQTEYPSSDTFQIPVQKNRTKLFFRGSKDEWETAAPERITVSPWREPDEFECRFTEISGRDAESGALWEPLVDRVRFHIPWHGAPARLFVELPPSQTKISGTIQVYDKRSNGIGVALARREGGELIVLERRIVLPGQAQQLSFSIPGNSNNCGLLFDANGNTLHDTADLTGFGIIPSTRAGVLAEK